MESFRNWLSENPRSRPLLLLGLGALLFGLFAGVLMVRHRRHAMAAQVVVGDQVSDSSSVVTSVGDPSGGAPSQEQPGESPQAPKLAWIRDSGTPARSEPALNQVAIRTLKQGEQVNWIREDDHWDQVRLADATEVWVQSRQITFTPPASAEKPSGAQVTVTAFYEAIARKDYAAAYSFLTSEWKAELDFDHFVRGYERTDSLQSEIVRSVPLSSDRTQVDVKVKAVELGAHVTYMGFYTVERRAAQWQMASGELSRTVDGAAELAPGAPVETVHHALPQERDQGMVPVETVPNALPPASGPPQAAPAPTLTPDAQLLPPGTTAAPAPAVTPTAEPTDSPGGGF
jgi:hypothetical protein